MENFKAVAMASTLRAWPVADLRRVWRLAGGAVQSLELAGGDEGRLERLRAQAFAVGSELARRGEL
jgi:hypothetical protein